jgi:heme oxygenase
LHERIEGRLDLVGPGLSLRRYTTILKAFHGFIAPLEARLRRLARSAPPLGFPMPWRAPLIRRDLVALGLSARAVAALPRCPTLPELSGPAHLAGCLYVLEGSRLGGQVIGRALAGGLGIDRKSGAAFFTGGESPAETAARWRSVLAWLDAMAANGADPDEMVAAACETFATLDRWLEIRGVLS